MAIPSAFLMELPREEMEVFEPTSSPHIDKTWDDDDDAYVQDVVDDESQETEELGFDDPLLAEEAQRKFEQQTARPAAVMTAAQLLDNALGDAGEKIHPGTIPPSDYVEGMIINHPDRGLGRIVKLSGKGDRRTATVQFFDSPRLRNSRGGT